MPKPIKHDVDSDEVADQVVSVAASENDDTLPPTKAQISQFMAAMGRKGGKVGGKRRLETMSAQERQNVARKAAQARWKQKED